MLYESTNYYETPQKKNNNLASYSKSSYKLKNRKDKRRKEVIQDLTGVKKMIDFNRFDDRCDINKDMIEVKNAKIETNRTKNGYIVMKLR